MAGEEEDRKEQKSIPASKVKRATRFLRTGAKVGRNYAKYYTKKLFVPGTERSELDEANARDIYNELSQLKGSALKVAQMLSMDRGMLPKAYADQFANAQYKAPPLSAPLVVKTFREQFGMGPNELFDTFELRAGHAASIGQVHRAEKDDRQLAVKVQYPGIRDSVKNDLRLVKPIAARIMRAKQKDIAKYFEEVEARLLEETDYPLEIRRGREIGEACAHIPNLVFPDYHNEWSGNRIITMDWLPGLHMGEFLATNPSQEVRNSIGQAMWEFVQHQMHVLGRVHADPHPGNFLMQADGTLGVIDFGCVKEIPEDFYSAYFSVLLPEVRENPERLLQTCYDLDLLDPDDTETNKELVLGLLQHFLELAMRPFFAEKFDFGDDKFLSDLFEYGMKVGQMDQVRDTMSARGSRHALYINRTFFGLFSMLNQLGAVVRTGQPPMRQTG